MQPMAFALHVLEQLLAAVVTVRPCAHLHRHQELLHPSPPPPCALLLTKTHHVNFPQSWNFHESHKLNECELLPSRRMTSKHAAQCGREVHAVDEVPCTHVPKVEQQRRRKSLM